MKKTSWAVVVLGLFYILAGCGIANQEAKPVPADKVGEGVIKSQSDKAIQAAGEGEFNLRLYFVDQNNVLEMVPRNVAEEPTVQSALDALAENPLKEELESFFFLDTKLMPGLSPQATEIDENGNQVITVSSEPADLRQEARDNPERAKLIFSQISCTVDWFQQQDGSPINGIIITDEDGPINISNDNGELLEGAATPSDFNNCLG